MKERPILFSAPMVRALLAGTKTQTRRVAKVESTLGIDSILAPRRAGSHAATYLLPDQAAEAAVCCPYGQPGDRLWVRETWQGPLMNIEEWEKHYFSDADEIPAIFLTPAHCQYAADGGPAPEFMTMDDEIVARWKPSIHMPRWASRILVEITNVRIERLQDISEADAAAEGVATWAPGALSPDSLGNDPSDQFRWLWTSINGPSSWHVNPWVWALDFQLSQTHQQGPKQ